MNRRFLLSMFCAALIASAGGATADTAASPGSPWHSGGLLRSAGATGAGVHITTIHSPAVQPGLKAEAARARRPAKGEAALGGQTAVSMTAADKGPDGPASGDSAPGRANGASIDMPLPFDLLTSGGPADYTNGWNVLDRSLDTTWDGVPATSGCWIVFSYDPGIVVSNVAVDFPAGAPTNVLALGAVDVDEWFACPSGDASGAPVFVRFLWLIFPPDPAARPVRVSEVRVRGVEGGF